MDAAPFDDNMATRGLRINAGIARAIFIGLTPKSSRLQLYHEAYAGMFPVARDHPSGKPFVIPRPKGYELDVYSWHETAPWSRRFISPRRPRASRAGKRLIAVAQTEAHVAIMDAIARDCAILRRDRWHAKPPRRALDPDWNYNAIVVHYTGHANLTSVQAIQDFDVDHQHWDDMAYHYAVTPGGTIYEGRELQFKGSHLKLQNTGKIGIVCMGDFDDSLLNLLSGRSYSGDPVAAAMLGALERLSRTLLRYFPITTFGGHREYGISDTCPGDHLLPLVQKMRGTLGLQAPVFRRL
jgi:hypothetical protein